MSILTYNGKFITQGGKLVSKLGAPPESTIFLVYGAAQAIILKSVDSGVNFIQEASTNAFNYGPAVIRQDASNNLWLGLGNGWLYHYDVTTKVFDSSVYSGASSIYDIRIRDNVRIAGDLNGNIHTF